MGPTRIELLGHENEPPSHLAGPIPHYVLLHIARGPDVVFEPRAVVNPPVSAVMRLSPLTSRSV